MFVCSNATNCLSIVLSIQLSYNLIYVRFNIKQIKINPKLFWIIIELWRVYLLKYYIIYIILLILFVNTCIRRISEFLSFALLCIYANPWFLVATLRYIYTRFSFFRDIQGRVIVWVWSGNIYVRERERERISRRKISKSSKNKNRYDYYLLRSVRSTRRLNHLAVHQTFVTRIHPLINFIDDPKWCLGQFL